MSIENKRTHSAAFGCDAANRLLADAIAKARDHSIDVPSNNNGHGASRDQAEIKPIDNSLVARLDLTENGALQFENTGYAPLDLFFGLVRSAPPILVEQLMSASWSENANETIRVLMHARDARHGKGERSCASIALLWLRKNKPITYLRNLNTFIELGYFKDLLQIAGAANDDGDHHLGAGRDLVELDLFAAYLKADLETLKHHSPGGEGDGESDSAKPTPISLSLAAKYAPSEGRSFDKKYKFASRIARLLFPEEENPAKMYRTFLSLARSNIGIVESQMSSSKWSEISYGKVPARAHRTYRKAFLKHEQERYDAYLAAVRDGKNKINTAGTQPHELVRQYLSIYQACGVDVDNTVEAQWNAIIHRLEDAGKLKQSLSVVDVSASMSGQPMEVAVALGLVTAQLNRGCFSDRCITFSSTPQWEIIRGDSLRDKVENLSKAEWGMSTNLEAVLDLILDTAIKAKCPQDDLPSTLFIFSDMQFDYACCNANTDTLYKIMRRKYLKHKYKMPNVVFWNLRASHGAQCPVTMDEAGTALVSGFSAELLKLFLDGEELVPMTVMRKAIEPYSAEVEESEI